MWALSVLGVAAILSHPLFALLPSSVSWATVLPLAAISLGSLQTIFALTPNRLFLVALPTFLLILFVFFAFNFSYDGEISQEKLTQFILVVFVFGVLLGMCFINPSVRKHMPAAMAVIGLVAMMLLLANPSAYDEGRTSFDDANPIWLARAMSLAGAAGVIWIVQSRHLVKAWGLVILAVMATTLTGSRGPLVATICALAFGLMVLKKKNKASLVLVCSCGLLIGFLLFSVFGFSIPGIRGVQFFSGEGGESTSFRALLYTDAIGQILATPEGIGIGNFSFAGLYYPHNIIFEFLVEWGWVAGGCISLVIIFGGYRVFNLPSDYDVVKIVFIIDLINALFSGDITSPRLMYAAIFVGLFERHLRAAGRS